MRSLHAGGWAMRSNPPSPARQCGLSEHGGGEGPRRDGERDILDIEVPKGDDQVRLEHEPR
eukprot:5565638-Alexandrium_andersonii.AAC.1